MWRTPPRQIEAILLAWVGVLVLLAGFGAMRLQLYGLKDVTSTVLTSVCMLIHIGLIAIALWAPFVRMRQRYARQLVRHLPPGPAHIVSLSLVHDKRVVVDDVGALSLQNGRLRFEGLTTAFVLPRRRLRTKPGTNRTLHLRIEGKRYRLTLQELAKAGEIDHQRPLEDALARFWNSPSGSETIEPPTEPDPKPWSGRRFPGFSLMVFWTIVNVVLIVQTLILQNRGLLGAQRVIAHTYFATLCVASAIAIARLIRTHRDAIRNVSAFDPPALAVPKPTVHESPEVSHVHA